MCGLCSQLPDRTSCPDTHRKLSVQQILYNSYTTSLVLAVIVILTSLIRHNHPNHQSDARACQDLNIICSFHKKNFVPGIIKNSQESNEMQVHAATQSIGIGNGFEGRRLKISNRMLKKRSSHHIKR